MNLNNHISPHKRNLFFFLLGATFFLLTSCEKEQTLLNEKSTQENKTLQVPVEIVRKLKAAGFDTSEGLRRFENGYLVEYDILLTEKQIDELVEDRSPNSNERTEHYRTNNLVRGLPRIINVYMDSGFGTYMQDAFDAALARYNELQLQLTFRRTADAATANISILSYYEESIFLGFSSGFPSGGNPASPIKLNTYYYNDNSSRADATSVIAHEIGHAIGFRHTDYMNRAFSCRSGGNEGDGADGAVHIPGTPTDPESNSWMLACSSGRDRPFTEYDRISLGGLYGIFGGNEAWTTNPFYGSRGTYFADVTGDRKADAIVVNEGGITVRRSTGSSFSFNETWTSNAYYGSRGTYFADVTGDGKADAIVVNEGGIIVRRSLGHTFSYNEIWASNPFYGSKGTYFADVTGDGKADAIAVNDGGITVRQSTGASFSGIQHWTANPFFGFRETLFADVTGDGKADAIVFSGGGVTIRRSSGSFFAPNETWTTGAFYGAIANGVADVTGDRRADAIVVNSDAITVRQSFGNSFSANLTGTMTPFYGSIGTFFVDVTGDNKADAIMVTSSRITVRRAN